MLGQIPAINRFRVPRSLPIWGSQVRSLGGLIIMLAAIAHSAQTVVDPVRVDLIIGLSVVMVSGWLLLTTRWITSGVCVLGLGSVGLMLVLPGSGAVIGAIASLVYAGLRLSVRGSTVVALVIGVLFTAADAWQTQASSLVGTALTATGLAFASVTAASVRRIRKEHERTEAILQELQQTRAAEIERAALAERARISREIHDVLAHTLSSLAVQLQATRMLVEQRPGDPATVAAVERAHRLASEGLTETRRAIEALRGDHLPGPDGLQQLVTGFGQATGTRSYFVVRGKPMPLVAEAQLALYRTAQEALTNVRKHANAPTSVSVWLRYSPAGTELLVDDEASPCTPSDDSTTAHYGLVGLRERAALLGGSLDAGPTATGYRVRLWLPRS
jgi:signal transduction histidine kinase